MMTIKISRMIFKKILREKSRTSRQTKQLDCLSKRFFSTVALLYTIFNILPLWRLSEIYKIIGVNLVSKYNVCYDDKGPIILKASE